MSTYTYRIKSNEEKLSVLGFWKKCPSFAKNIPYIAANLVSESNHLLNHTKLNLLYLELRIMEKSKSDLLNCLLNSMIIVIFWKTIYT